MAYIALYRKWRPKVFDDLVGQGSISRILKNQIINQRIAHAYLFSGGRGTGKTTTAKIFSRAVNCISPKEGNPCNECEICTGILSSNIMDVVEIDAASNNSVDDVRNIRDEVFYTPNVSKYRVYIIDEVHMLSTGAFNALLKILEEPPKHVVFILATTEPHKLPATILSRCQRFEFKQISIDDIGSRLKMIVEKNSSEIDDNALDSIARAADGSMRDAISILDQCMDGTEGITSKKVIEVIGAPTEETIIKLAEAILIKDLAECMSIIDETIKSGKDISQFVSVMVRFFRDVLIFKTTRSEKVIYLTASETNSLKEIAGKFSQQRLIKIITSMSELEANMRWASLPRVMFEIEMVKFCSQEEILDAVVEKRIARLEELLSNPVSIERISVDNSKQLETIAKVKTAQASKSEANISSTHVETANNLEAWSDVVSRLKSGGKVLLYANLIGTKAVKMDSKTIGIVFSKSAGEFGKTVLAKNENLAVLKDAIKAVTGQEYNVKCITDNIVNKGPTAENKIKERSIDKAEELAKEFDIPINIIEE